MARIPKRLAGPMLVDLTVETIYTVPSNTKAIVRHIHYSNPTASTVTLTVAIGTDAAATRVFDAYSVAAGGVLDHFCYYPMEEAEIIQAKASADDTTVITVSGEEIVLG